MSPVGPIGESITVVICTRNRGEKLARTLGGLARQSDDDIELLVVDQSDGVNVDLEAMAAENERLAVIRDAGRGVSRSRNIGWRSSATEWVAYIDDDCVPDPDWSTELKEAIRRCPEASFISGQISEDVDFQQEVPISTVDVAAEEVISGRRRRPDAVGLGVCAMRRSWLARVGGFDERLGKGTDFPGSADMDFNRRFLGAGGVALVTPRLRVEHEQWRSPDQELVLWRGYFQGWAAFTIKQLWGGDVIGALQLSLLGWRTIAGVLWGAMRMRSTFQLRRAGAMLAGFLGGGARAAARRW